MNIRIRPEKTVAGRANPRNHLANAARLMISTDPDVWLYRMVAALLGDNVIRSASTPAPDPVIVLRNVEDGGTPENEETLSVTQG